MSFFTAAQEMREIRARLTSDVPAGEGPSIFSEEGDRTHLLYLIKRMQPHDRFIGYIL
jgi:hypothetical protein